MEEIFYEYVVGGRIKLADFLFPNMKDKYQNHPDFNKSGHVLIPTIEDGKHMWLEESIVQKCAVLKDGAKFIYLNNDMEVIPPLLPQ
jgi:hypothetical protein